MYITAASRAVLVVASSAVAFTVGVAVAKSDRDAAMRHCTALARAGTLPSRPSIALQRRRAAIYRECMEQAGFGRGHAKTK